MEVGLLKGEIDRLRAENARLAAERDDWQALAGDNLKRVLRLNSALVPTIEFLSRAASHNCGHLDWNPLNAEKELARLRAITERKQ